MAGRVRLTEEAIAKLRPGPKPYTVGDVTKGLRVHVAVSGRRTYQLGRSGTTLALGECGTLKLAEARQLAMAPTPTVKAVRKPPQQQKIADLIDRYMATDGAGLVNKRVREKVIRQFLDGILDKPITALTREFIIARQQAQLAAGYRGTTVQTNRRSANIFANWCIDREYLDRSPFRKLPKIPVDLPDHFLDDGQMRRLELACRRWPDLQVATAVLLALNLGLRKGEIHALRWSDFDFDEQVLRVRAETTKTRKGRKAHLPSPLLDWLKAKRGELPDERPFLTPAFDLRWRKLRAAAGIDPATRFHDLRHSYASYQLRHGSSLEVVRRKLGHSNIAITARYLHASEDEERDAAKLMGQPLITSLLERGPRQKLTERNPS